MGHSGIVPGGLLSVALAALAARPGAAGPGDTARYFQRALLLLQPGALAAGYLAARRSADPGRGWPVPGDQRVWPALVRLYVSANGMDRPVHVGRALGRRRPQRTDAA